MAFVLSDGKITGLDRAASMPSTARVQLSDGFAADYATLWRTQPHVRTVVGFLARNIAQIGLHVYERVNDTDRQRLSDHPLANLLRKPNSATTRYRFVDALVNDLGIYDVACWMKAKGDTPGLLRLPPDKISPLGENWLYPEGVRFRGTKGFVDIPSDQIVLFRGYNPSDARWGVSPMETLRQILAEEYQATIYRAQLWRNGARFPGHIERPANAVWTDPQRERFRSDWRGLYTGDGPGAGGTPVLEDGMKFVPGGITPLQAQYLETRKLTREEVASAYHIPLPMVGILDHATFSNITEQHKNLYQDTLGPWLEMIQQEIELQLLPDFDTSGRVYVEFNLAEKMKGSFEEQAASLQTAVGGPWLTRNEARARQNLPGIEGGDELIVPMNVTEGGQASPTDSGSQNRSSGPTRRAKVAKPRRRLPAKAKGSRLDKARDDAAGVLLNFFDRQSRVIKSALGSKDDADWWDGDRWDEELASDLYDLAMEITPQIAGDTLKSIGFDPDEYDPERTTAWLQAVSDSSASSINAATKDRIAQALGSDDPDALDTVFADQPARAESGGLGLGTLLASFASVEATRQVSADDEGNYRATKTWITGANPRPEHAALDGETVGLDEDFSNGAPWPGGDGEFGCNCDLEIDLPD